MNNRWRNLTRATKPLVKSYSVDIEIADSILVMTMLNSSMRQHPSVQRGVTAINQLRVLATILARNTPNDKLNNSTYLALTKQLTSLRSKYLIACLNLWGDGTNV